MKIVQELRVEAPASKVPLQDAVDAGLQDDVVIARHQTHLHTGYNAPQGFL